MRTFTGRPAAVAGVAIAAALVTGCGSKVAGGGARGEPPVLHLAAAARGQVAATADAVAPAGAGGKVAATYGSGEYRLQAAFPATPDGAAVYRPKDADLTAMQKLADALGIKDPVTKTAGGYRAGKLFSATKDGQWSYGAGCPIDSAPGTVSDCAIAYATGTGTTAVGSGVSSDGSAGSGGGTSGSGGGATTPNAGMPASYPASGGTTVTAPGAPAKPTAQPVEPSYSPPPVATDDTARKAAAPIIDALGLGAPTIQYGNVSADPVVDGLRVVGAMTSISVEADGHISYANGRLLSTTKGSSYPLISAKDAFAALPPRPMPMYACADTPGTPVPCPTFPPPIVTAIELGLNLTEDATGPLLVPAWLFTVKDDVEPTAVTAVQPKYIGAPPTPSAKPGSIEPGSIEPASIEPASIVPPSGAGSAVPGGAPDAGAPPAATVGPADKASSTP